MPVAVCCTAGEVLPQRRRPSTLCRAARAPRPCCHAPASPSPFLVPAYFTASQSCQITLKPYSPSALKYITDLIYSVFRFWKRCTLTCWTLVYKRLGLNSTDHSVVPLSISNHTEEDKWGKMMTSSQLEHVKTILALGCLHLRLTGMFISCFRCLWVDFH
uniref:Uncharacterized protein n=1 Tax=Oryza glumipatula TaxID=40148 RepID=A0A0D9ZI89_9ORYZ